MRQLHIESIGDGLRLFCMVAPFCMRAKNMPKTTGPPFVSRLSTQENSNFHDFFLILIAICYGLVTNTFCIDVKAMKQNEHIVDKPSHLV